jgi:hypothetical protein
MELLFTILGSLGSLNWVITIPLALIAGVLFMSIWNIGPTEVGLVRKRFSFKRLDSGSPVALHGEAGYQADLLTTGLRFKLWPLYTVTHHPLVQIPAGQIGVVIAQVGGSLPIGAKSGIYKPEFGNFQDLKAFMAHGGQKGVQRSVLSPGSVAPIHPVGFLVVTMNHVYGVPVAEEYVHLMRTKGDAGFTHQTFGLSDAQMQVVRIAPRKDDGTGKIQDMIGIVTTLEGTPSPKGAMANRLGDFTDVSAAELAADIPDSALVEMILASKNDQHNNYQDFQQFLEAGGRIGLQHDPLLYGAYNLNPFLVSVEMVPMLVVNQGEVAVVKAYVGLATEDTSGVDFKFGSLVRPGHRGIWQEPLRTGKYAINPRVYSVEIVPTFILSLNWADATSTAHTLDKDLKQIIAKSKEGFVFNIDLQVQIHVPDTKAPRVISIVGNMKNLVNEVLQAAVGNHFRDKLQSMEAIKFITERAQVQKDAQAYMVEKLKEYEIETRGVYIQDVALPEHLVQVLTSREIANQQKATYTAEKDAQDTRLELEASRGRADMQKDLAKSTVGIEIAGNQAEAVKKAADGESYRLEKVGKASAVQTEAEGLAIAAGLKAQERAVGRDQAAAINIAKAVANGTQRLMPENLALNLGGAGGRNGLNLDSMFPLLMQFLQKAGKAPASSEDKGAPVTHAAPAKEPHAAAVHPEKAAQPVEAAVTEVPAAPTEPPKVQQPAPKKPQQQRRDR